MAGQHKLTAIKVDRLKKPGHHGDGHGLYLIVRKSGSKSWSYVWIRQGRRREMGLGGFPSISLAQARKAANLVRKQIGDGFDPFHERDSQIIKTFGEVADELLSELRKDWTHPKHEAQWVRALNVLCLPLRPMNVATITTNDVLRVLKPIWIATPVTGRRLRSRIERVLNYAHTHGWRDGENVARWGGHLEHTGLAKKHVGKHFAAMPYQDIPGFVKTLQSKDLIPAMALEYLILTAGRTNEILGANWDEIDLDGAVWTIPASRMKAKREHKVPLPARALEILRPLYAVRGSEFVFMGKQNGKPLSNMSMAMLMRRIGVKDATVHGFRSSFRDWAGNETGTAREVAEAALSHQIGNKVEQAYRRGDALDKRRRLMQAWADYCGGKQTSDVVRLHG